MKEIINKTINITLKLAYILLIMFIGGCLAMLYPNTIANGLNDITTINTTEIHNLALNITSKCNGSILNDFCKCNAVNQWIYDNIEYVDRSKLDNSPTSTLNLRQGVCRHNAVLACSMLKSIGIECYINTYQHIYNNIVTGHAWFEVDTKINNKEFIIKCDPTNYYTCMRMSKEQYIKDYGQPLR